jgi:hypothetical protein
VGNEITLQHICQYFEDNPAFPIWAQFHVLQKIKRTDPLDGKFYQGTYEYLEKPTLLPLQMVPDSYNILKRARAKYSGVREGKINTFRLLFTLKQPLVCPESTISSVIAGSAISGNPTRIWNQTLPKLTLPTSYPLLLETAVEEPQEWVHVLDSYCPQKKKLQSQRCPHLDIRLSSVVLLILTSFPTFVNLPTIVEIFYQYVHA